MIFKIATGVSVDINPGQLVTFKPGFVPNYFEGKSLAVTKIEDGYPFVRFQQEETYQDENGDEQTRVIMDEESAVSPEIIASVQ